MHEKREHQRAWTAHQKRAQELAAEGKPFDRQISFQAYWNISRIC